MSLSVNIQTVKCPNCRTKLQYLDQDRSYVTIPKLIKSDPETGVSFGICKRCDEKVFLPSLKLV